MFLTLFLITPAWGADPSCGRVGILVCLSGDCASWGQSSLNGALLAIEEVNLHGGVNGLKLVPCIEDSHESKLSDTITAFQKLASNPSIRLILGPTWAQAGMALGPLAMKKNLLLVTPSIAVAEFSRSGDNLFNVMPPEDLMTAALVDFSIARGWRRVAIFSRSPVPF